MTSSEMTLPPFEKIHSSGSAQVRFHASQEYRAVITVDSNLEEYVVLKTINKTLDIDVKKGRSYSFTNFIADVYCPGISGISISGSGNFESTDKITAETFESKISGYGKIDGNIECDTLSVNISGSGKINHNVACNNFSAHISGSGEINITGTGKEADVNISGSGNFNGTEFQNNRAAVRVSGSGNISMWVLEYLKANISGSGNIKYRGNPKIDYNASGSGRLISE
jgi:cytoskeletal protein CcmA (bactofilin family)